MPGARLRLIDEGGLCRVDGSEMVERGEERGEERGDVKITHEVVLALATLRQEAGRRRTHENIRQAINALDNADVFREIDEATDYDVTAFRDDLKKES